MERAHASAALDQGHHRTLTAGWIRAALVGLPRILAPDETLIRFNDARELGGHWGLTHGVANAVAHEPLGLVGQREHAVKLMRADALLRRAHQVDRHEPLIQRDM